jgi:hypothetical protein
LAGRDGEQPGFGEETAGQLRVLKLVNGVPPAFEADDKTLRAGRDCADKLGEVRGVVLAAL